MRCLASLAGSLVLTGCQGVHPVIDTLSMAWPWRSQYAQLQPGVEYMVVTLDSRATVMALGERRDTPSAQDPLKLDRHEYWYSSQHETLHTVNGRIHRALGFAVELRSQESSLPTWNEVQKTRHEVPWTRVVDLMPGYRYGQVDHLWIKAVPAPSSPPQGVTTQAAWFEEAVVSSTPEGRPWKFRQRFAVLDGQVAYSEQCLAPNICLSLRPLTVSSMEPRP